MLTLDPDDFVPAACPVALAANEIQVWLLPAARPSGEAVRDLLSRCLGCARDALVFGRGEFGKPRLKPPHALEFNVSHSRGVLLVGISRIQPLGVDVESPGRKRPVLALAERFFAASEAAALRDLDPALQAQAFLALWSCKEAVVKALGRGLGFGLGRVAFTLDANGDATRLNVIDASAGAVAEWHIVQLRPFADHVGALAWRGPPRPVRAFAAQGL